MSRGLNWERNLSRSASPECAAKAALTGRAAAMASSRKNKVHVMPDAQLLREARGAVEIWKLNSPQLRNALTHETKELLERYAAAFVDNPERKCVIITGTEEFFCAGGDIRDMEADRAAPAVRKRLDLTHSWMKALAACEKPVITAVNGAAVGAGFSLALTGDIVIASDRAYFMAGFSRVGVLPDMALLYHLPRAVGLPRAKDILITGPKITSAEALAMGIVSRVYPHATLSEEAIGLAERIAAGPSMSIGLTKSLLNLNGSDSLESFLHREQLGQAVVFSSEDFLEGTRSFKEKRKPQFKGR